VKKTIAESQIEAELQSDYKPTAIESGVTLYPFSDLDDRAFERLCYLLLKEESAPGKICPFSSIALMQGVGERGRDIALYRNGKSCGVIQCKKFAERYTRPALIREIVKFLMYGLCDSKLLPDVDNFEYHIYISSDLTGPAIVLCLGFKAEIEEEIANSAVNGFVKSLMEEYESLAGFGQSHQVAEVDALLRRISVSYTSGLDLSRRLQAVPKLIPMFFNVKPIIDLESADKIIREALKDFGLQLVTDHDLAELQERIGKCREDERINTGLASIFGYHIDFLRHIGINVHSWHLAAFRGNSGDI